MPTVNSKQDLLNGQQGDCVEPGIFYWRTPKCQSLWVISLEWVGFSTERDLEEWLMNSPWFTLSRRQTSRLLLRWRRGNQSLGSGIHQCSLKNSQKKKKNALFQIQPLTLVFINLVPVILKPFQNSVLVFSKSLLRGNHFPTSKTVNISWLPFTPFLFSLL